MGFQGSYPALYPAPERQLSYTMAIYSFTDMTVSIFVPIIETLSSNA
jgi:hypothetical protein